MIAANSMHKVAEDVAARAGPVQRGHELVERRAQVLGLAATAGRTLCVATEEVLVDHLDKSARRLVAAGDFTNARTIRLGRQRLLGLLLAASSTGYLDVFLQFHHYRNHSKSDKLYSKCRT